MTKRHSAMLFAGGGRFGKSLSIDVAKGYLDTCCVDVSCDESRNTNSYTGQAIIGFSCPRDSFYGSQAGRLLESSLDHTFYNNMYHCKRLIKDKNIVIGVANRLWLNIKKEEKPSTV